jgi:UDP-N-acetylglucosamine 2-epimerase (non-hydrolysing)
MKMAPIIREIKNTNNRLIPYLVHTGQHYDKTMKETFFRQLNIPEPDVDLGVGSGTHAMQTAQIMLRFESVVDEVNPFAVLVVGDVNSTIACGLVTVKKQIPLIHVEAGLRSYDRAMPEEINRVLTDQISDLLFTTERSAQDNLTQEGIARHRVHFVGNVMIDTLFDNLKNSVPVAETLQSYGYTNNFEKNEYALLTLHRPSNVDNSEALTSLIETIIGIGRKIPVIFPVHPRTQAKMEQHGLLDPIRSAGILLLPPVGYLQMLGLTRSAKMVLTDSGGIQEETTALGIPCLTLRENTERPITVVEGTNTIVGADPLKIAACVDDILSTGGKTGRIPEYWDGQAAKRIIAVITENFSV